MLTNYYKEFKDPCIPVSIVESNKVFFQCNKSNKQINLLQGPNGVQETTCCVAESFLKAKKGHGCYFLIPFGVVFVHICGGEAAVGFVTSHHSSCVDFHGKRGTDPQVSQIHTFVPRRSRKLWLYDMYGTNILIASVSNVNSSSHSAH